MFRLANKTFSGSHYGSCPLLVILLGDISLGDDAERPPIAIATREDEIITITQIERWHEVPADSDRKNA